MGKDPYRYFRVEARELLDGLSSGVLALERGDAPREPRGRLLRFAHTLKGAARVVRQTEIAERAHAVEDALQAEAPAASDIAVILREIAAMSACLARIGVAETVAPAATGASVPHGPPGAGPVPVAPELADDGGLATLRVEVAELDGVQRAAVEAAVHLEAVREQARALAGALRVANALVEAAARPGAKVEALSRGLRASLDDIERALSAAVGRAEREVLGARDAVDRLRLVPARSMFDGLERGARDAATAAGVSVTFHATGGDVGLEAHVLESVRQALLHVVRNAAVHGGEPEAERRAAGKPAALGIRVDVARRGERVAFRCDDDGRGVDLEAVKRAAMRMGALEESVAGGLGDDDAARLVFGRGLTTRAAITEIAGRGVGLDVVRETANALGGSADVRTTRGRGTTIELVVPASLTSLTVLVVVAGHAVSVPMHAVVRTVRVGPRDVVRTPQGDVLVHDGAPVAMARLSRLLGTDDGRDDEASRIAVLIEAEGGVAALGVDRLVGATRVAVRSIPAVAAALPIVAGASIDPHGDPQLVLDPGALVALVRATRPVERGAQTAPVRRPILVVDDSLTTRMLEQSILESAGYEVALATSAEDALEIAKTRRFALFLVDVEMPGMSGFEFVACTREDAELRETPAILVTSRASVEDRQRGAQVGASAYVVKGEFDQVRLLETVRRLVG